MSLQKTKNQTLSLSIEDRFYEQYKELRQELILEISTKYISQVPPRRIIEKSQKILNRLVFICFCEDVGLLPENTLRNLAGMDVWDTLKDLFVGVDKGCEEPIFIAAGYNGELFKHDVDIDDTIQVSDALCKRLVTLSNYDFRRELPADILGHIFEKSITDLERLKIDNGVNQKEHEKKRHNEGIYYTPPDIVQSIIEHTLQPYLEEKKTELRKTLPNEKEVLLKFLQWLPTVKVLDPACGSGAFLVQVYHYLLKVYKDTVESIQAPPSLIGYRFRETEYVRSILQNNLYGVDLNTESVEITKLSLWLRSATPNEKLVSLRDRIKRGNSVLQPDQHPDGFDWERGFGLEEDAKFDVILGNPPYVRQELIKQDKTFLQKNFPEVYTGTADLYVYFFALGLQLLKPGGYLGFISSNKFLRCKYGQNLRTYLKDFTLTHVQDQFPKKVFSDAEVDPCVLILHKQKPEPNHHFVHNGLSSLDSKQIMLQSSLKPHGWHLPSASLQRIFEKMQAKSIPLGETGVEINYGIKTGYNNAFIIDEEKYKELIRQDPRSREIIHPVLRGRDLG